MSHFGNDFVICPALRAHRVFALRPHRDLYTPKKENIENAAGLINLNMFFFIYKTHKY